jgi:hypothetical protein
LARAQNTFAFKGKVIHNKKGLMKQFSILVNNEVAITNDAGIFVIGLNHDVTHVKIGLQHTGYTLLYPTGGYVSIPRDLNDVPEIIIGSPQDNTYINQYLAVYKEMKSNSSATASELIALGKRLDSLQQILLQLNYTETDLRSAKEMQDGRDKYYPEISQNLQEFVDKAFDLKTSLKYVVDFAFEQTTALQNLISAVRDYNTIFNTLSRQRFNYEKFISEYWQNDSLTSHFHEFITYALDTLHQGKILTLQDDIAQINQYFTGSRDKNLKEKIQQNINREIPLLEQLLKELDKRNNSFQKEFSN